MFSIGLIADTHVPTDAKDIPDEVRAAFRSVDLILHAGDIHLSQALDWLETIAPVLAAKGNGDYRTGEDRRLKNSQVVVVEGFRIGVSHGLSLPPELPWRPFSKIMMNEFGGPVDVFVFGDTHVAEIYMCEGVLMINPGSPTLPHNLTDRLGTVGRLDITRGKVRAFVIPLDGKGHGIQVPGEFVMERLESQ